MRTYPLKDEDNGFQFGFELDSIYIRLYKIVKILSNIEGISNIKRRRLFDFSTENHIEFDYLESPFAVWEPYGDNSRYWVVPMEESNIETDISEIENAFKQYKPSVLIKIIGDLSTLNFKGLLRKDGK